MNAPAPDSVTRTAQPPVSSPAARPARSPRLGGRLLGLRPYFARQGLNWLALAVAASVGAATEPMIPALLKPLLDRGFVAGQLALWQVPAALLLLFGLRGLASYSAQLALTRITQTALERLRAAMFAKLLRAPGDLFARESASSLSNTLVHEAQNGAAMLVGAALNLVRNSLTLLALTAYLFYLNWALTLIVAAIFPAVAWVMSVLTRRVHSLSQASQQATDALAYAVEENVLAQRDVRLHAAQGAQQQRFATLSRSLERLSWKSTVAGAAMTPMTQMLAAVALSAVITVALWQSQHASGASVGGFAAFVTAMLMIVAPIRQLSEVSSPITRALVALERAVALIEHSADEPSGAYRPSGPARGQMQLRDLVLRYPGADHDALQIAALDVEPGQTLALVGASGSGKTTLVNVLPRFVEAQAGVFKLDGVALTDWDTAALRAQIALVSQNVVLLNQSVAENVALGQTPDPVRVRACLQAAHLGAWLDTLPEGLDARVGHNAARLSGGQRQRLAIARALYKDAPILILDEATSALDNASERAVQDALQTLMRGRTTLVIAHRLSTVQHADCIVVLEHGRVVEQGRHADLLARNGAYAKLYRLGLDDAASARA